MAFTVGTEACTASLNWSGVEASFVPGFPALDPTHIAVTYAPNVGVPVALTAGVHYSAAIDGAGAVTVTPIAMPAAPGIVIIDRKTPAVQTTNFINLGSFSPDIHTQLHDAAAMRSAESRRDLARALLATVGPASGITVTPAGNISSTNVQGALAELDTEKAAIASLANVALSGAGVDMVTNGVAWTPVLTFATPGNLAVTYATQFGRYHQLSSNLVLVQFNISTSAFTFTTASGNLQITGLPFTDANLAALRMSGSCSWGGINKAGYSQLSLGMPNNNSLFQLSASGMGQAIAAVTAADTPTGGSISLIGEVIIFLS